MAVCEPEMPAAVPEVDWLNVGHVPVRLVKFHVPVGVYDPPSSSIVSSASLTVFARVVPASGPVMVVFPVVAGDFKLPDIPVESWLRVGTSAATMARKVGNPELPFGVAQI